MRVGPAAVERGEGGQEGRVREEGVARVQDGEGFVMELFVDGEDGGVEVGGGWVDCGGGEGLAAGGVAGIARWAGVWGWVDEEVGVDLLADLEGEVEEVGHYLVMLGGLKLV